MKYSSVLEIDKQLYSENLQFIRSILGEKVQISSVVKGNAYGHGIEPIANLAMENGIKHFSVFSADEARKLHQVVKDKATIMIMGFVPDEELHWVISNGIEFYVYDIVKLPIVFHIARDINKPAIVHLEAETGFNRMGLNAAELKLALQYLVDFKDFIVFKGLCTHLAGAESIANYIRLKDQIKRFRKIVKLFHQNGVVPEILHAACSAATIWYPEVHFDLVRIGILQYGFWPNSESFIRYLSGKKNQFSQDPLKRIISWKSEIMSLKHVKQGEFIGYGNSFLASIDMVVAVIPVGYAHGFARTLSNQGRVIVHGERVGVVGLVNMNCMLADVTDIENVKIGDSVTLIGKEGNAEITVASFGESSEQMNYELLTRLPSDIPRKIKN